ncbi:DUF4352 domain-containing protein [Listeria booriae]|uniref:DUF4352 domain-containing protein n=1 Tax=Listeria booriae TaxID=1552123 RepID=A0A841Y833_9LIST|nr:hypothetical protein [Listeria booriae]MBC1371532.1 DUF4352 domain-containing protein [Listeria booriae]
MKRILFIALSSLLIMAGCEATNDVQKPAEKEVTNQVTPAQTTVSSLVMSDLKLSKGSNQLFDKAEQKTKVLYQLKLTIKNSSEDNILISAAQFKALTSEGKYIRNFPTLDELGQALEAQKKITEKIYFAPPKNQTIEKIIYEDKDRAAYQEWKVTSE